MASPTTITTIDALFTSTTSTTALTLLSTLQMLTPLLESYFFSFELRTLLTVDKRTGALAHAYLNKTFQQTWWKKDDDAMRRKIREELDHLHTIRTSPSHTRRTPQDQSSLNTQLRAYFLNTFTCTHTLHIPDSTADTMTTSEYFDMVQDQMEKGRVIETISSSHYAHLHSLIMKEGAQLQLPMNHETRNMYRTGGVVFRRRAEQQQVGEQKVQIGSYPASSSSAAAAPSSTSSSSSSTSSTSTSTLDEPIHTQNLADFGRQLIRLCLVTQKEYMSFKNDPNRYHQRKEKLALLLSLLHLLLLSNPSLRNNFTSVCMPAVLATTNTQQPTRRQHVSFEWIFYQLVLKGEVFSENKTEVEIHARVESKSRWYFKRDHWLLTELVYEVAVFMKWFTLFVQVDEEVKEERMMEKVKMRRRKEEEEMRKKNRNTKEQEEQHEHDTINPNEYEEDEEKSPSSSSFLNPSPCTSLDHLRHLFLPTVSARPNAKQRFDLNRVRVVSMCDQIEIPPILAPDEEEWLMEVDDATRANIEKQKQQCQKEYEQLKENAGQIHPIDEIHWCSEVREVVPDKCCIPSTPSRYTQQVFHSIHHLLLRPMLYSLRIRTDPLANRKAVPFFYDQNAACSAEERGSFYLGDLPYERYDLLEIFFSASEFRNSFRRTFQSFESRYYVHREATRAKYIAKMRECVEFQNQEGAIKLIREYGDLFEEEEEASQALEEMTREIQENKPAIDYITRRDLQKMIQGFFASRAERRSFGRLLTKGWIKKALNNNGDNGEVEDKKEVVLCQATQAAMKKTRELMEEIARKKHENHATSSSISASSSSSSSAPAPSTSSIPPSSLYHRFLSFLYFDCIRRKDVFLLRTLTQLMLREDNFHAAALYDVETGESPLHYMERHAFGRSRWRIFEILLNSALSLRSGNLNAVLDHTNVSGEVTFRELVRKNWNRDLKERLEEQYPHVII